MEILTYLTPGNLAVSSATSVSFKDAERGWNSGRKRTLTNIVVKSGQRHKKWSEEKCAKSYNILLVSARFSRNDRNNPFCLAIALETLWMTVHVQIQIRQINRQYLSCIFFWRSLSELFMRSLTESFLRRKGNRKSSSPHCSYGLNLSQRCRRICRACILHRLKCKSNVNQI